MFDNSFAFLHNYIGTGLILFLFAAAFIYVAVYEKEKEKRAIFLWFPLAVFVVFFCPLFTKVFDKLADENTYFRILWMIPFGMEIAYALSLILQRLSGKIRNIVLVVAVFVIAMCGSFNYKGILFERAENLYQVPDTVVEICDEIECPGREVMALFPYEFITYVRQYSPTVCLAVGRDMFTWGLYSELSWYLIGPSYEAETLSRLCKAETCHYVIIGEDKELIGDLTEFGYELIDVVNGYSVYRDTTISLKVE